MTEKPNGQKTKEAIPSVAEFVSQRSNGAHLQLVQRLESLLERARSGALQGLIYAGACAEDGEVQFGWVGGDDRDVQMAGALHFVTVQFNSMLAKKMGS